MRKLINQTLTMNIPREEKMQVKYTLNQIMRRCISNSATEGSCHGTREKENRKDKAVCTAATANKQDLYATL